MADDYCVFVEVCSFISLGLVVLVYSYELSECRQYLKQECLDKKGKEFDTNGWQLLSKRSREIPQQMNGSDCGMFACKYADYVTKDKPITFTQQHMPYFRKRMVWEILHQKLL